MEAKKTYFIPRMELMLLNTADVMKAADPSDTPTPPGEESKVF